MSVVWRGNELTANLKSDAIKALQEAGEHLKRESQHVVPIDEHDLERSAMVDVNPSTLEAEVSYNRPYAARQHEELTWRHKQGRKAKYLEDPAREEADTIKRLIASRLGTRL